MNHIVLSATVLTCDLLTTDVAGQTQPSSSSLTQQLRRLSCLSEPMVQRDLNLSSVQTAQIEQVFASLKGAPPPTGDSAL